MLYILIGISGLGFKMMTAFSRYENGRQHGQTAIFVNIGNPHSGKRVSLYMEKVFGRPKFKTSIQWFNGVNVNTMD